MEPGRDSSIIIIAQRHHKKINDLKAVITAQLKKHYNPV